MPAVIYERPHATNLQTEHKRHKSMISIYIHITCQIKAKTVFHQIGPSLLQVALDLL